MDDIKKIVTKPIFFERNRVYRIYEGGLAYHQFLGDEKKDSYFPEEWLASKVKAINPKYFTKRDGVSIVKGTNFYFDDLLKDYKEQLLGNRKYDCLVKYLDSSIRLPVQVHPDKNYSKKHFNSEYGKTEAWLVIATRPNAKIYFGFKDKIDKQTLSNLEEETLTNKNVMESILCSVEAKVGDMYIIKAGLIHAIGAGCTIIEIQEPTDFTIQPENWCGQYKISEEEKYIGLDKSTALDCFNYNLYGQKALDYASITPKIAYDNNNVKKEVLISYEDTTCFAQNRYTLTGGSVTLSFAPSVWIVLSGTGTIIGENYKKQVKMGDYFYLPYVAENKFKIEGNCVLIECLPSKQ